MARGSDNPAVRSATSGLAAALLAHPTGHATKRCELQRRRRLAHDARPRHADVVGASGSQRRASAGPSSRRRSERHHRVPDSVLPAYLLNAYDKIKIMMSPVGIEELSRIWAAINQPYRLSIAYEISLVQIMPTLPRKGSSRGLYVADYMVDARFQIGTAPDEQTAMRYPTRASEFDHRRLRVPLSPLHDPSPDHLHAGRCGECAGRARGA